MSIQENLLKNYVNNYIVIVRNPSAQILSWYGRNYLDNWQNIINSPFKLYKFEFENNFLEKRKYFMFLGTLINLFLGTIRKKY